MQRFTKAIAAIMLMTAVFFAAGCNKEEDTDAGGNNSGNTSSDVRVTTYTPQDITQTTAICGGDVIVAQGLSLSSLGVCWSTERNPTAEDAHLSTTNWSEPYVCTITGLEPGTKYHVRAYALRGLEYYYGEDKDFTTEGNSGGGSGGGNANGHDYVDLGLPSGLLWATCNVGANAPEEYGDYFAWGETQPKNHYDWNTYKWCNNGDSHQLTKYCNDSGYGCNGFTDNLPTLQLSDDVARANWGGDWRMPTWEEGDELRKNTTNIWTTRNGVNGQLFTASNGASLFMPAAGSCCEGFLDFFAGSDCNYWSSSIDPGSPSNACNFFFSDGGIHDLTYRQYGLSVRAVLSTRQN